jgi:Protein of unknown function (DUF2281)
MSKTMEIDQLPRSARRELLDFYDFLVQKYVHTPKHASKVSTSEIDRQNKLQKIYDESHGQLPEEYKFNREEANER